MIQDYRCPIRASEERTGNVTDGLKGLVLYVKAAVDEPDADIEAMSGFEEKSGTGVKPKPHRGP
jgi:hypothetical protein